MKLNDTFCFYPATVFLSGPQNDNVSVSNVSSDQLSLVVIADTMFISVVCINTVFFSIASIPSPSCNGARGYHRELVIKSGIVCCWCTTERYVILSFGKVVAKVLRNLQEEPKTDLCYQAIETNCCPEVQSPSQAPSFTLNFQSIYEKVL
ncbi:unnamed protein product [Ranitomeya imitator]|uniref:Uncharacterized protein n=1 Tax=Ranitomeya imitator TaxID=111125 RepID=A0ABN9KUS4_9NEOB|nr:unnamed protein product [Ranitomeya imitator]